MIEKQRKRHQPARLHRTGASLPPVRRHRLSAFLGLAFALALVFFVGLALGRVLEATPRPGGTQTLVRTLEPATIGAATRTVTVTTSGP